MGKTAIILGATGLTGGLLLEQLVEDEAYASVKVFSRRPCGIASPKIREYIGDVLQLEQFREDFSGDVVFCCVGTTSSKTRDRTIYRDIDYGIPVKAARMAKEEGIPAFLVVSALGSNPRSRIFYNRTKGEMERDVLGQGLPHTCILRPSLIVGKRAEKRLAERIGAVVLRLMRPLLVGRARKYRSIEAASIARAMIRLAEEKPPGPVVDSDRIEELGG